MEVSGRDDGLTEQEYKRKCEVAYWVKVATRSRRSWLASKERLVKKRGQKAVNDLVHEMEEYRNETRV